MKTNPWINSCLIVVLFSVSAAAFAAQAPDELVKSVSDEVLSVVRKDAAIQQGDANRAAALVEQKVLPHFDFERMTSLAMGQNWRKASPAQRDWLVASFRKLLVRTYSKALTEYRDQEIEFKPSNAQPGDTKVTVRTKVLQPDADPVSIDYALEKQGASWKVYDLIIANASLVTNYRSSFASKVRQQGVDGLIASLEKKNAELAAKTQ